MMINLFRIVILLISSTCCLALSASDGILTVPQFRALAPVSGNFKLTGFVVHRYQCPPCPEGAMCKPCIGDHVVISESAELLQNYPPDGPYVVVFTPEPEPLSLGKRYIFNVEVLGRTMTGFGVHDLRLRGLAPVNP